MFVELMTTDLYVNKILFSTGSVPLIGYINQYIIQYYFELRL